MKKACGCVQGDGGFKAGYDVRISTVYFPFLKIFLIKMKMIKVMEVSLGLHLNS